MYPKVPCIIRSFLIFQQYFIDNTSIYHFADNYILPAWAWIIFELIPILELKCNTAINLSGIS